MFLSALREPLRTTLAVVDFIENHSMKSLIGCLSLTAHKLAATCQLQHYNEPCLEKTRYASDIRSNVQHASTQAIRLLNAHCGCTARSATPESTNSDKTINFGRRTDIETKSALVIMNHPGTKKIGIEMKTTSERRGTTMITHHSMIADHRQTIGVETSNLGTVGTIVGPKIISRWKIIKSMTADSHQITTDEIIDKSLGNTSTSHDPGMS